MIGSLLNDRYRLDAELGRGGMSTVYRAHDTLLDRDVAVKMLSAALLTAEGRARLLGEARSVARLNHPNIVSVYDAGEANLPAAAIPFVVMELVEGPSLHQRRPAGLDETLAIASQVCAALEHAHAHGIVHRDLKPENVLLAPGSMAKLNDFGLARSMVSRLTSEGTIVGTVFYLAPEVALGREFDGRADLYSLGVMLYELVTGELPFVADDPIAVISQHLHAPVVPPRARNPGIPADLDALIVQLLSKQPADRPASATEVGARLARLASGEAPGAVPELAGEPALLERIVRGRLVAREQELAQVRGRWQRARAGEGQVLLVSGEPGVGKTRLVRELLTQVRVSGAWALLGECYAEGGAPFEPFAQILDGVFQDGAGPVPELSGSVLADLAELVPALRNQFPDLPPALKLDPHSQQQRLFESMVAFWQALCAQAPLLLVLEDAHWADSGSLALLRHLARRLRRQPALLVATYREVEIDGVRPFQDLLVDLNRERLATRLKLARLDRAGTHDLLAALFAEEITPEFLEGIYRETEGNPFFVEEVCKALAEGGQLYFADGRWHRPTLMDELLIPQSVRAAIQARLVKLPSEVHETLNLAAILGREFDAETLAAAADLDEEALVAALEMAERAQLIEEVKGRREVVFAFVHALIAATLADEVPTLRRRRLHRRAAAAVEEVHPADDVALAHHWAAAGDDAKALAYCTRAGERASAAYANVEAERHFLTALDLVQADAGRAHLLAELGRVQARQGRYRQAIDTWRQAISLRQRLGDWEAQAWLYAWSARAAWNAGEPPRGLTLCREGLAAVEGAPDSPGLATLLHETARACAFGGLPQEAESLCRRALEMAERVSAVSVQADALITLGSLPGQSADQALAALSRAVELAEAHELLTHAARAHNNLAAFLTFDLGDQSAAREHVLRAADQARQRGAIAEELFYLASAAVSAFLTDLVLVDRHLPRLRYLMEATVDPGPAGLLLRAVEALMSLARGDTTAGITGLQSVQGEARQTGDLQLLSAADNLTADALLDQGRVEEAALALLEAIEIGDRGLLYGGVWPRCTLSALRARQGRLDEARRLLSEARQKTAEGGDRAWDRLWLPIAEAEVTAAAGEWPAAWAAFQAAVDGFGQAGMRWTRAHTLAQWAEAHTARGQAGDGGRARELLREARADFEAMGATFYARQAERRLGEVDG